MAARGGVGAEARASCLPRVLVRRMSDEWLPTQQIHTAGAGKAAVFQLEVKAPPTERRLCLELL